MIEMTATLAPSPSGRISLSSPCLYHNKYRTITVSFPCINYIKDRLLTANYSWSGWNDVLVSYWIYLATRWGWVGISHWWIRRFSVYMVIQESRWYMRPTSDISSFPNHNLIPGKLIPTSIGIVGFINILGVVKMCALNTYVLVYFFNHFRVLTNLITTFIIIILACHPRWYVINMSTIIWG